MPAIPNQPMTFTLSDLRKSYPLPAGFPLGRAARQKRPAVKKALAGVSITLGPGLYGLLGPNGAGKSTPTFETGYVVRNGDIVGITIVTSGNTQRIGSLVYPDELRNVPNTAWSGKGAVTVNGRTYTVPASVPCYNTQTNELGHPHRGQSLCRQRHAVCVPGRGPLLEVG